jgi:hypothetical protein
MIRHGHSFMSLAISSLWVSPACGTGGVGAPRPTAEPAARRHHALLGEAVSFDATGPPANPARTPSPHADSGRFWFLDPATRALAKVLNGCSISGFYSPRPASPASTWTSSDTSPDEVTYSSALGALPADHRHSALKLPRRSG